MPNTRRTTAPSHRSSSQRARGTRPGKKPHASAPSATKRAQASKNPSPTASKASSASKPAPRAFPRRTRSTAPVTVTVDVALKKLYAEALDRLEKATAEGAKAWDVRYEAISDILEHEPPLYLAGGFSAEHQFFAKHVGEDRTTVYRNTRVAKYATPAEIETYSASRLSAAIVWLETKNGGPLKGRNPIDFAKLRIPVREAGQNPGEPPRIVSKPLAELSVEQLRGAIALLKGRQNASKKASPEARELTALLSRAKVKGVTFELRRGTVVLRVPLDAVAETGKALAAYRAPTSTGTTRAAPAKASA